MASWRFLEATEADRSRFADWDATHALASADGAEPAGPPNRFRDVVRLTFPDGSTYFVKRFARTQLKNRIEFARTRPRCRRDAEREALVTVALREAGIGTPRPIAVGICGQASVYVCAELHGRPLATVLADHGASAPLCRRVATWCGERFAAGQILPDLAADHVWLLPDDELGVLDLHNASIGRRPTRRDLRRALRRVAKSVRGLAVPRRLALAFAARFLRAAGCRAAAARRAVVAALPPFDTHGRYDVAGRSSAYRGRSRRRTERELELLRRVWPEPVDVVVDAPCGAGRLGPFLRARAGASTVLGLDRSSAMLAAAAEHANEHYTAFAQADATALPLADASVDAVVVFRFLHHLPPAIAARVVAEAARVARRYVVLTFFHPVSAHGAQRALRRLLTGSARTRFAAWPRDVRSWFRSTPLRVVRFAAESPYRRDLWIAVAARRDEP